MNNLFNMNKKLINIFFQIFIVFFIVSCTVPFAVPLKEEGTENTRNVFEKTNDEEKEIASNENIEEIIDEQKISSENLAKYGPSAKKVELKDLTLNRRKDINTYEPSRPAIGNLDEALYQSFPITVNFSNTDIREAMRVFAEITNRNILVGKEVDATLNVELREIPWRMALKAILDIEDLTWTIDERTGLIRIHTREKLKEQKTYEQEIIAKLNEEKTYNDNLVDKVTAVFQLYYVDAATMLSRLVIIGGSEEGGEAGSTGAAWTILAEETQNQIIATAGTEDLDFIEKIINEVDRPVKQVLIEAIIVKATDTFQEELGARLGGALNPGIGKNTDGNTLLKQFRGIQNDSEASATPDSDDQTFATASSQDAYNADRIANFGLSAPTMGLGIIADIGFAELKGEIFTMQSEGLTKTVDNPKVFVLDNQEASIISGSQIAYSGGGADSKVEMVDAALSLTVTPQIVGDGNIKLALKVNNDSPSGTGANPPISKLSIDTGLIIKDGDVVVIGGVFANTQSQKENKVPILGDIPVLGRLFRSDAKVDNQEQVLIFIAPRVL